MDFVGESTADRVHQIYRTSPDHRGRLDYISQICVFQVLNRDFSRFRRINKSTGLKLCKFIGGN
nr:MAG TPA: hypothetical protein [Caudoviricetes sp.]